MATLTPIKLGGPKDLSFVTAGAAQIRSSYYGADTAGNQVTGSMGDGSVTISGNKVSWTAGYVSSGSKTGSTTSASRSGNTVSWGTGWITSGSSSGTTVTSAKPTLSFSGNTVTASHTITTGWVSASTTSQTYTNYRRLYSGSYTSSSSTKSFYNRSSAWRSMYYVTVAYSSVGFKPNFIILACANQALWNGAWIAANFTNSNSIYRMALDETTAASFWCSSDYGFTNTPSSWTSGNITIPVGGASQSCTVWFGQ